MVWLVASLWVVVVLSGGYLAVWLFSQLSSLLARRAAPQGDAYDDDVEIENGHSVADFSRRRSIEATHKMVEFLEPVPAPTDLAGWRESAVAHRPQVRQGSGGA